MHRCIVAHVFSGESCQNGEKPSVFGQIRGFFGGVALGCATTTHTLVVSGHWSKKDKRAVAEGQKRGSRVPLKENAVVVDQKYPKDHKTKNQSI